LPESALVVGVGSQGLLACVALIGRGVRVHATDVNPERVALAMSLGAHGMPVDATEPPFDLVVDTVGAPATIEVALANVGTGGTVLVIGLDANPFEISAQTLVRRQIVLRGSLTYDHPADFRATVARVQEGLVAPGRIVTEAYPLEDAQQAFESSGSARGKTWIRVGSSPLP
jgi:alcohol dehydrogenase/L-iditol 2-dehydrogenase